MKKEPKQYYFTLKGSIARLKKEYQYYTKRPWSLTDVGKFWDTVDDYDVVNEEIYPYYRRFTNSKILAETFIKKNVYYNLLDIQARSGKGTEFWSKIIKIKSALCVDFSDHLISLADKRLKNSDIDYEIMKIEDLPIKIVDEKFNLILCYETVEHIYDYSLLLSELARLLTKDGIIILTCPAVSWEWVHWLSAIININHSEGPHRFLKRNQLIQGFKKSGLHILAENSTILLPFNNKISIYLDQLLEKYLPKFIKSTFMLRRSFILKKCNSI